MHGIEQMSGGVCNSGQVIGGAIGGSAQTRRGGQKVEQMPRSEQEWRSGWKWLGEWKWLGDWRGRRKWLVLKNERWLCRLLFVAEMTRHKNNVKRTGCGLKQCRYR